LNRYNPSERLKTKYAFDLDFDTYFNTRDYSFCSKQSRKVIVESLNMRKNINFNVERSIVYFNDHKIILSGKNMKHNFKQLETFSNFEFDSLASALIEIVEQYMVERNSYSARSWRILNTLVVPIFLTSMQATMSFLHGYILMISNAKLTRT